MMAEGRRYGFVPQLDMEKIFLEARRRWLHPVEVCEILKNHKSLKISLEPLIRPTSGSFFLFDRKITRYFRKDGHAWRKKKDGKTVKEAHEKLKYGSVVVVHCYYAHGENNETFQRRSYWMLEKDFVNIALVHYLETKESSLHITGQLGLPTYCPINSISFPNHFSSAKPNSLPSQMDKVGYNTFPQGTSANEPCLGDNIDLDNTIFDGVFANEPGLENYIDLDNTMFDGVFANEPGLGDNIDLDNTIFDGVFANEPGLENDIDLDNAVFDGVFATEPGLGDNIDLDNTIFDGVFANEPGLENDIDLDNTVFDGIFANEIGQEDDHGALHGWQNLPDNFGLLQEDNIDEPGTVQPLKEGDSFSRWMSAELIGEVDVDSLQIKSNSDSLWNNVDVGGVLDYTRVSSHAHGVSSDAQVEKFQVGPMISQDQLFNIADYSPNWAYANSHTKVLVMGTFMKCEEEVKDCKWSCMFGEIEVPCELLLGGTLRCCSPSHKPGRVPFYITLSNRLACSEIREFEFQESDSRFLDTSVINPKSDHSYRVDQFMCSAHKKYPRVAKARMTKLGWLSVMQ